LLITNGMLFRQNVDYCVEICWTRKFQLLLR
jgi:hypothetical protein